MANSLFPGYVVVDYHSEFAAHTMTIPTREPSYSVLGNVPTYENWAAGTVDGDDMVEDLIDALAAGASDNITYDGYTIWHVPSLGADPIFVNAKAYSQVGTDTAIGWAEAVQRTFTYRTSIGGIAKLVQLDVATGNNFGRYPTVIAPYTGINTSFQSTSWAWAGRDGAKPQAFKNVTVTLNEQLRRSYHLG